MFNLWPSNLFSFLLLSKYFRPSFLDRTEEVDIGIGSLISDPGIFEVDVRQHFVLGEVVDSFSLATMGDEKTIVDVSKYIHTADIVEENVVAYIEETPFKVEL